VSRRLLVLTGTVCALVACSRDRPPSPGSPLPSARVIPTAAPSTASPAEALDRLDARAPVPLLPMMAQHQKQNMRDHLLAVQEIVAAVASDDFAAVERAARRIGSSETMGQMCSHMGAGAPGFTEQALGFHRRADEITAAARARDRRRVLAELGTTLQTCTSCHAAWKQRVVDEATWQRLAASGPPHG